MILGAKLDFQNCLKYKLSKIKNINILGKINKSTFLSETLFCKSGGKLQVFLIYENGCRGYFYFSVKSM